MKTMEDLIARFGDDFNVNGCEVLLPAATALAVMQDYLASEVKILGVDIWKVSSGKFMEDPNCLDLSKGVTPDTPAARREIAKVFIETMGHSNPSIERFSLVF